MVKKVKAIIRYDGPALSNHEMDVHDLAPSLLALGELCREANFALNGQTSSVRVLVRADMEQKCFQLGFELAQTLFDQAVALLEQQGVQDAKNILEWIGIIGASTAFVGGSLFTLVKWMAKRQQSTITYNINDGAVVYIASDNSRLEVPLEVHKIAQSANAVKNVQKLLEPVATKGYEVLEFEYKNKVVETFDKDAANEVLSLPSGLIIKEDDDTDHISKIRTGVRIKRAVYEGDGMWTIIYHRAVEARMGDSEWLERFQRGEELAPPKSVLDVDLIVTVPVDSDGIANGTPKHEISKVHGVKLPPKQTAMFGNEGSDDDT